MQAPTEYGWKDGRFYLREPGQPWKHLSEYESLHLMDRSINNQRCLEMAETIGEAVGFSEGYCLHQMWVTQNSKAFKLVNTRMINV